MADNRNGMGIQSSRRSLLKSVATFGTLMGAGTLATNVSAEPHASGVRYEFSNHDTAYYGDGGVMTNNISEWAPVWLPGPRKYLITLQATTNAAYPNCSGCGINDELDTFYQRFNAPDWNGLHAESYENDPKYCGASAPYTSGSGFDYESYAWLAVDYATGKLASRAIDYGMDIYTAGKFLAKMLFDVNYKNNDQPKNDIKTEFDWWGGTHQATAWNKYDVKANPGADFYVDVVGKVNRDYIPSISMDASFRDYWMFTPSSPSPSNMTTSELESNGFAKVPVTEVRQNPYRYGLTTKHINQYFSDDSHMYIYTDPSPDKEKRKIKSASG